VKSPEYQRVKEHTDTARFRVSRNAIAIGSGVVGAIGTSGNRWGTDEYEDRRPKNYERTMHLASTTSQAVREVEGRRPSHLRRLNVPSSDSN
jgi:hypothetical protein